MSTWPSKLLPCPFCGKAPTIRLEEGLDDRWPYLWRVSCENQGCPANAYATAAATSVDDKYAAVTAWNTRA